MSSQQQLASLSQDLCAYLVSDAFTLGGRRGLARLTRYALCTQRSLLRFDLLLPSCLAFSLRGRAENRLRQVFQAKLFETGMTAEQLRAARLGLEVFPLIAANQSAAQDAAWQLRLTLSLRSHEGSSSFSSVGSKVHARELTRSAVLRGVGRSGLSTLRCVIAA